MEKVKRKSNFVNSLIKIAQTFPWNFPEFPEQPWSRI